VRVCVCGAGAVVRLELWCEEVGSACPRQLCSLAQIGGARHDSQHILCTYVGIPIYYLSVYATAIKNLQG